MKREYFVGLEVEDRKWVYYYLPHYSKTHQNNGPYLRIKKKEFLRLVAFCLLSSSTLGLYISVGDQEMRPIYLEFNGQDFLHRVDEFRKYMRRERLLRIGGQGFRNSF